MNKVLQRKIKTYVGAAGAILIADQANGQIVYVDINPDEILNIPTNIQTTYDLDMNQDGNNDFHFSASKYTSSTSLTVRLFGAEAIGNNAIMAQSSITGSGSTQSTYWMPKKFTQGQTINNQNWHNATYPYLFGQAVLGSTTLFLGDFNVGNDAYLGVKLNIGGQTHFGWIRVEIITNESFAIKGFAYETQPNTAIIAGNTGGATGMNELNSRLNIFSGNSSIHISASSQIENASVKVFDLLGKEVYADGFTGMQKEIVLDKKGIYFVEIQNNGREVRRKVFVSGN